ncbi:MAG: hypothetical protein AB7K09_10765 [Planctomycetota bacterium]
MPRHDLLALTEDDLVALSNRGNVRRGMREIEAGEPAAAGFQEAGDGTVSVIWADDATCTLPGKGTLKDGTCTCVAGGMCRHLVRTVLYYWSAHKADGDSGATPAATGAETAPAATAVGPWDPGAITDEQLASVMRKPLLMRAQSLFEEGLLLSLVRSRKPVARLHAPAHTVRFLVPGDPRYTICDCGMDAPCIHVPIAVAAFRKLPADELSGLVTTQEKALPVPVALLDDIESTVIEFARVGAAGSSRALLGKLQRAANRCADDGLVWPGTVIDELMHEIERYTTRDAAFAPGQLAVLIGELIARSDAIRGGITDPPQPLIRGSRLDATATLGRSRYVGLGCGAEPGNRRIRILACLQDMQTGTVGVVEHAHSVRDPNDDLPADYVPRAMHELASWRLRDVPLSSWGSGQVQLQSVKRDATQRLIPGRAAVSASTQAYAWEELRPPVLVENIAELQAHLRLLPPSCLRPRRVAEDFHVLPVRRVVSCEFDVRRHALRAELRDSDDLPVWIEHPYTSRGAAGFERLFAGLQSHREEIAFVSGKVARSSGGPPLIRPFGVVFGERGSRWLLQPWVDRADEQAAPASGSEERSDAADDDELLPGSPAFVRWLTDAAGHIGELLTSGIERADGRTSRRWREFAAQGESAGLDRLARAASNVAATVEAMLHTAPPDATAVARAMLVLSVMLRLASDTLANDD